jgi:anti-sigma regulatory factor (Ser/Thr protein kinase)
LEDVNGSHDERAPAQAWRVQLAPDPRSPGEARRFVDRQLRDHGVPEQALDAALLVSSELVTNAYQHGEGEIELRVSVEDDHVRIEVIDAGHRQAPAVRHRDTEEAGGWGLQIVDQLAAQWGVFEGTTHVWADLPLK